MSADSRLGTAPVDPEYHAQMVGIAHALDDALNPGLREDDRTTGFILMVFPIGDKPGRCNYISNAERENVIVLLREQLAYFEGMPEPPPAGGPLQ